MNYLLLFGRIRPASPVIPIRLTLSLALIATWTEVIAKLAIVVFGSAGIILTSNIHAKQAFCQVTSAKFDE